MKKLNKIEKYAIVMEALVMLMVVGLIVVISIGFDFDFNQLAYAEFWLKVGTKLILCMFVYNVFIYTEEQNRRLRRTQVMLQDGKIEFRNSLYQTNVLNYREKKREFYGLNADLRYELLKKALDQRNQRNRLEAYDSYLHSKVTTRIAISQIDIDNITPAQVDDLCLKLSFTAKQTKKFKKAIQKLQNGEIKYSKINDRDILVDKLEHREVGDVLDNSQTSKILAKNNISKALSYSVCTIVATLISWSYVETSIWREIMTNLTVVSSAVFSAYKTATKVVDFKSANYEERVHFLSDLLNPMKKGDIQATKGEIVENK